MGHGQILAVIAISASIIATFTGFALAQEDLPKWVRDLALWLEQGLISDQEYQNAINFLVKEEIIKIQATAQPEPFPQKNCSGNARCITGYVTEIIDGDTIKVDGQSIRFALVNTPEYGQSGYNQATDFIARICPVDSPVLVDEDDGQTQGSYGRIIAVVHCNGVNLNEQILGVGLAEILTSFCYQSEFASHSWAQKYGCDNSQQEYSPPKSQPSPIGTPITVSTDRASYKAGDFIRVSGKVNEILSGYLVSLQVFEPRFGNQVAIQQFGVRSDGTFSTEVEAGGGLWRSDGTYTIIVLYGSQSRSAETTFEFSGSGVPLPTPEPEPEQPSCDPSYPDVCIPPPPPDLDCGEISHRNFRVVGSDPHRFDGDGDGIGCES